MEVFKCCLCKKEELGSTNNPYPLGDDKKQSCCDACNIKYVLKARMLMIQKEQIDARLNQMRETIRKLA